MRRLKRLVCDEDAAELVEFAVASMIFFTLIFGIIAFCLAIYAGNFVAYAAQQGTRYWMVRGSDWTNACSTTLTSGCQAATTDVQNYVVNLPHPGINLTAANITPTALGTTATGATTPCATTPYAQGCQVKVKVSYTFGMNIPFIPANDYISLSIPFTSTSIETIQD
jgi:Flp pilus assembly protein TadG